MILLEKEGIEWLQFEIFQPYSEVVHGVFLRKGGTSEGTFASLNMESRTGDCKIRVDQHRAKVRTLLSISKTIFVQQCHEDNISCIEKNLSAGDIVLDEKSDGLMTRCLDVGLSILHADCQAVLFYDPVRQAIANVHCGWRGNVANILGKTVHQLCEGFGSRPQDLLIGISPSLGPSRSEFINYEKELPSEFYKYQFKPYYFDLWKISCDQLKAAGVLHEHIQLAGLCTYDHPEMFFSYRREKPPGSHVSVIALKK